MILVGDCRRVPLPDNSVDLVLGSPPYMDARTYGIGAQRDCQEWVTWMLDVITELRRVCRGPVIVVAAGVTRDRNYWPGCEGLMWEWWKRGGDCQLYRPCIYHRVGIPGSGGQDWFRADTEFVMCFKGPGPLPWSDNTAMGHPPKWAPGGEMSYRNSEGTRRNQWGAIGGPRGMGAKDKDGVARPTSRPSHIVKRCGDNRRANGEMKREPDGEMREQSYDAPVLANPGNRIEETYTASEVSDMIGEPSNIQTFKVGGGQMGSELSHENEAPFSEKLVEWFALSLCPPDGTILDPWSGSGTTPSVAKANARKYIAMDIRMSQAELTRRRLNNVTAGMFA